MYGVETRVLKQAVKRNMKRFEGEDFMFVVSEQEIDNMVSQFVIPSKKHLGGASPFAFTELGVAMLSSVLNSDTAIYINKKIMRAFVAIRQYLASYSELRYELIDFMRETRAKFNENDIKFDALFKLFDEYIAYKKELEKPRTLIGFNAHKIMEENKKLAET